MISKNTKLYCKDDYTKIENYELAVNDKVNTWEIHHKLELTINGEYAHSKLELIRLNMYYNRPYYELIYLTTSEHAKLHGKINDISPLLKTKNFGKKNGKYQKCTSEFGKKYLEHFGYSKSVNYKQYYDERNYYKKNGKCSWE